MEKPVFNRDQELCNNRGLLSRPFTEKRRTLVEAVGEHGTAHGCLNIVDSPPALPISRRVIIAYFVGNSRPRSWKREALTRPFEPRSIRN